MWRRVPGLSCSFCQSPQQIVSHTAIQNTSRNGTESSPLNFSPSQLIYLFNVGGRERERENTSIGWLFQSRQSCVRLTQKLASSISNPKMIRGRFGMNTVSLLYRIDVCVDPLYACSNVFLASDLDREIDKEEDEEEKPVARTWSLFRSIGFGKRKDWEAFSWTCSSQKMIHGSPKLHFVHGSSLPLFSILIFGLDRT